MEMNNTTGSDTGGGASKLSILQTFQNLYPSLLQCFTIILLGYCTARLGYITPTASKGISVFVSLLALPALLFKSMVQLDFSRVNWPFWNSILIGKIVVFFTVMLFTLVLVRPTNLGKAGIYAIFSVHSNDLALGYPLLKAIYQNLHPEYVDYIYLFAPVTVVCLNPIGFFLMEIHKQRNTNNAISKFKVVIATLREVVTNPIVFMTFIGILGNFLFHQKVPAILENILDALGQAFLATSLFYLGVKMVGNMTTQIGHGLKLPLLLIAAKILLLPLITREIIHVFDVGSNSNDTDCWSMFGFIYGTFPTAPTVPIFAAKFGIEEEVMTSSMVICTFLSAPVMFISAQMSVLPFMSQAKISSLLKDAMLDVSSVSIPFGVWVIVIFCLARRYRVYPHNFTLCLIVCQLLVCFSAVLSVIECHSEYWFIAESILFFIGRWGSFSWTAMVAVGLCLVRCRGDEGVRKFKWWIIMFGWGLPVFTCGIAILLLGYNKDIDPDPGSLLLYHIMTSMPAIICSMVVAFVCVVITVVSLVRLQRYDRFCKCPKRYECASRQDGNLQSLQQDEQQERCGRCIEREQQIDACCDLEDQMAANCLRSGLCDMESLDESTCLVKSLTRTQYTGEEAAAITRALGDDMDLSMEEYFQGEKHQLGRHVTMLLILLITMVLALFIYFLRALKETSFSGILIAMTTADSFFIFGQSFVVFACFGLEKQLVIIPFLKRWRKLLYGAEEVHLPKMENLDPDVIHLCDQFNRYHKESCQRLLVSDKRYRLRMYKSVFRGDEFVNWLLEVGLAADRPAAVQYGHSLILGRVIRHVTEEHFFYDSAYFYHFC